MRPYIFTIFSIISLFSCFFFLFACFFQNIIKYLHWRNSPFTSKAQWKGRTSTCCESEWVCVLCLYNQHSHTKGCSLAGVFASASPTPLCWCGATLHQCKVAQNLGLRPIRILSLPTCVSLHILLLLPLHSINLQGSLAREERRTKGPAFTSLRPRNNISYSSSGWADPPILKSLLYI